MKMLLYTSVTGLSVVIRLWPERDCMASSFLVSVLGADAFPKREFMAVFLRIFCLEVR